MGDLFALAKRITGEQPTTQAFENFCEQNHLTLNPNSIANGMWWRFTEQYLAGIIGAASARTLLTTAMINNGLALGQVANILDQASQWQRFNQNLLMTMIDHMTQGVSVVDKNMCLVAWNNQYLKLFGYPKDLVYVGCPIADLIRYNAERGECGPGSVEEHVRKRLHWMKVGSAHEFERIRKDGRVIQMRGNPIAGGGFVTTFADITAFRANEAVLEARVKDRTQQLADALTEQQLAREQADMANMSKVDLLPRQVTIYYSLCMLLVCLVLFLSKVFRPKKTARPYNSLTEHSMVQKVCYLPYSILRVWKAAPYSQRDNLIHCMIYSVILSCSLNRSLLSEISY